jgi:uncharacterized membrane protein
MYRDANPQHWKFLVFYYNAENPRLFVSTRTGLPFTLNFVKTAAWAITGTGFALILLAAIVNNR